MGKNTRQDKEKAALEKYAHMKFSSLLEEVRKATCSRKKL